MSLPQPAHYRKSECKHFLEKTDMITSWKIFNDNENKFIAKVEQQLH